MSMYYLDIKTCDDGDTKEIILNIAAVGFLMALTFSGRGTEEEVKGILGDQIRSRFFVQCHL